MNKEAVFNEIIAAIAAQVESYTRAAKSAFSAATDPGSRAENKYDTRSLEASYLARGQAMRVAETEEALVAFKAIGYRPFAPDQAIALGALVSVRGGDGEGWYFIGPSSGGTEVQVQGDDVLVITPSSPLGQLLNGRKAGDQVSMPGDRPGQKSKIESVA